MNILFFLSPKQDLMYVYDDFTLRQTLEKWENNRYASIPVLNRKGEYVGTLTEGDEGKTSRDGVYAGGDAVTGAATVIKAMGAGKAAAKAMDEYIRNK